MTSQGLQSNAGITPSIGRTHEGSAETTWPSYGFLFALHIRMPFLSSCHKRKRTDKPRLQKELLRRTFFYACAKIKVRVKHIHCETGWKWYKEVLLGEKHESSVTKLMDKLTNVCYLPVNAATCKSRRSSSGVTQGVKARLTSCWKVDETAPSFRHKLDYWMLKVQ